MRIISGKYKRKSIIPPKNLKLRPTTDVAKEGLFNILNNHIEFDQVKVLDLFSGTGNISYEFASRGCEDITSIELNFKNFLFIKKTIQELQLKQIKVVKTNVFVYLKHTKEQFDLIFADPPYEMDGIEEIPNLIFANKILRKDGLLIIEHAKETDFSLIEDYWQTKIYGKVNFSFFIAK